MGIIDKTQAMVGKTRAALIAGVATLTILAGTAGYFYYQGHHAAAEGAKVQVEQSHQAADKAGLEAKGAQESIVRIQVASDRISAAQGVVTDLRGQAIQAEDANEPLDASRAARLLAADERLCRTADLPGCSSAEHAGAR